jgi:oxygen-independent coproporphyrinogen-3 oxidase
VFERFPTEATYAYPFADVRDPAIALAELEAADLTPSGSPLALYVHVPYCVHLCHFCGFVRDAVSSPDELHELTGLVIAELGRVARHLGRRRLGAIFFGGGTASLLPIDAVEAILEAVTRLFAVEPDAERTFEGECLTLRRPGYLDGLARLGFERVSFGVQTMDPDARRILNLRPDRDALRALAIEARSRFAEVAIDFIVGWPAQTAAAATRDAEELVEAIPATTIEVFPFEPLDAEPTFLRALAEAGAPVLDTAQLQSTHRAAIEVLTGTGFARRGYTVFTRRTAPPPRVSYSACYYGWDDGGVIGVGRGAQSFVDGIMWGNALPRGAYRDAIVEGRLPVADLGRYRRFEREQVTWPRRGWIAADRCGSPADELIRHGYVRQAGDRLELTALGQEWVPAIIDHLMPAPQRRLKELISTERRRARGLAPIPLSSHREEPPGA